MATYVLVGGAWIGSWAWKAVTAELRTQGHDVYPLSLTGLAERVHLGGPEVNLDTHIADVTNLISFEDLDQVVLAGHSYAGAVITGVADRIPEQLASVVFVDTAPIPDGTTLLELSSPEGAERLRAKVAATGNGWKWSMPSFEELGEDASLNGLTGEQLDLMRRKATPHPFGTYEQPLRLTHGGWRNGSFERVLVACNDFHSLLDAGMPQLAFINEPDWRVEHLPTGHWPMLSMPKELASILMG